MTEKICLCSAVVGHGWSCCKEAVYYVSGCWGLVSGAGFVCEEHKHHFSYRKIVTLADYWVAQGERALRDE